MCVSKIDTHIYSALDFLHNGQEKFKSSLLNFCSILNLRFYVCSFVIWRNYLKNSNTLNLCLKHTNWLEKIFFFNKVGQSCHLLSNQLVAFPENVAALRVAEDHPLQSAVLYHSWTAGGGGDRRNEPTPAVTSHQHRPSTVWTVPDFSCKRSLGNLEAVLSCDADLGIQTGAGKVQVDGGGSAHHLWKQGNSTVLQTLCRKPAFNLFFFFLFFSLFPAFNLWFSACCKNGYNKCNTWYGKCHSR